MSKSQDLTSRRIAWGAVVAAFMAVAVPNAWAQDFSQFETPPSIGHLYGMRIVIPLAAGILGFAIGAFFSPALLAFRRIARMVLVVAIVLFALFGPFPIADGVDYAMSIILVGVAFGFGLRLGAKVVAASGRPRPISFGSAKWANLAHLKYNGVIGTSGFMLGEFQTEDGVAPLCYNGERHGTTVAPTRSGKGRSSVIPNLLSYEGSAVVIDPKGENALITAYRRGPGSAAHNITGMGQRVFLVDPWNIAASRLDMPRARFNPLDWIQADDPDAVENAFLLADALVPMEGEGEARFFDEESKALFAGIMFYVATAPEEEGQRHLGRVRDILVQTEAELKETLTLMYNHPHPLVSSTAARTASKDPKLRSNVLASAQAHTHWLDSPRIRQSLERSDFRFEDLKAEPMTVFLILPADRLKTYDRWTRLLVQQAITVNARNIEQKPDKPILFLLDEMAAIGRLTAVEQAYSLMAGFGMILWGIVQDLSQLAKIYGENGWQTFISNSGFIQYFGSRDKMTAEYFSALCGVTTVEIHNFSWALSRMISYATSFTSGSSGATPSSSRTSSTTEGTTTSSTSGTNEAQRQLAYPDELMVLKGHQQIIFIENLDPIRAQKLVWYEHPALTQHGVNLHAAPEPPRLRIAKAA